MRKFIIPLFFLLLLSSANSEVLTIGVSPSELKVYGIGQAEFNINFYNTYGEVDAYYTVKADECINPYAISGFNSDILVPKGTTISNAVSHKIVLNGNFTQQKICYIYVYGRPVGTESQEGNVQIQRRIGVRMILGAEELKPKSTTTTKITTTTTHRNNPTTTTTHSSGNNISGTTTTTHTTTIISVTTTTFSGIYVNYPPLDNQPQPIVYQQEQSAPAQQDEQKQDTQEPKKGLANFFLNTSAGFFTLVGIIVVSILFVVFFIQRGKNKSQYNPLLQENQGVYGG